LERGGGGVGEGVGGGMKEHENGGQTPWQVLPLD